MNTNEDGKIGMKSKKREHEKSAEAGLKCNFPGMGVLFVILSCLFYSLNSIFVKMIKDLHPTQISLSRFAGQFLLLLPLLTYKRNEEDLLGKEGLRIFLWVRGICGGSGVVFLYSSIKYLPVGDAVTIAYSRMIMVPFIARIFLNEKLSHMEMTLAIFSLVGVVLIAKPSFIFPSSLTGGDSSNLLGVLYGLLAAMLQAMSMVTVRKLGKTYPPLSIAYYSICGAMITIICAAFLQEFRYPCHNDLPLVFSLGLVGLAGQSLLTLGLQRVRAGTVAVLQSSQLIFINILQVFVLGIVPSVLSIIGTTFLLVSGIILGIKKGRKKNK